MRGARWFGVAVCFSLCGCQVFRSVFGDNRFMAPHSHLAESGLYQYLTESYFTADNVKEQIDRYYSAGPEEEDVRKAVRNEMVGGLIYLIDVEYSKYADDVLYSSKALVDSTLGIATLGLTAGATITGHEATSKLLSGIATAVTGSREVIDKNIYLQRTVPTVVAAMDAGRAEQYAVLLAGMKATTLKYPLGEALRDVGEYYHRGTMVRAFSTMADLVGKQKDVADAQVMLAR